MVSHLMTRLHPYLNWLSEYPVKIIIGSIFLILAIAANIAWLNPDPEYVIKTHERIPIMWQYNGDAAVEFLSATYFPKYLEVDKTRTNRPGYPILAKVLGEAYGLIALPFYELGILVKGMLGYVTLKFLIYLSAALALYFLVRKWASQEVALLSVLLVFLHPFSIRYIGTFHTSELQFITPILLIALWLKLAENYSHKRNIWFSLIAGFLMLAKQNYAPYLAILGYSFLIAKKRKESVLSFVAHLVPLGLWLLALKFLSLPYYNHEAASNNDLYWIFDELLLKNPVEAVQILLGFTRDWLVGITKYFHIFAFLAMLAFYLPEIRERFSSKHWLFFFFLLSANWLQFLAARSTAPYLTSDIAIIIFPLAAYFILALVERVGLKKWLPAFIALYLLLGLSTIVSFPWIHPYDQHGVTNPERVKLLEEGKLIPRD